MIDYFFNCDWGTSRFRLRLVEAGTGTILAERRTADGVISLSGSGTEDREKRFRAVLDRAVDEIVAELGRDLGRAPVLISGMASSSMGWRELPYAILPFAMDGTGLLSVRLDQEDQASARPIILFSGVSSDRDVMRGEEIELMGLGVLLPDLFQSPDDVWVILPGTHSKHVRVRDGIVQEFRTYMTGELFHLLSCQSSLRHRAGEMASVERRSVDDDSRWREAFLDGVELVQQDELSANLFRVRSRQLLHGDDVIQSAALLSGLLIGSELTSLLRRRTSTGPIILAAAADLSGPYSTAVAHLGCSERVTLISPAEMALLSALGQQRAMQRMADEADRINPSRT